MTMFDQNSPYLDPRVNDTVYRAHCGFWVTFHIFCENSGPKLENKITDARMTSIRAT